VGKFATLKPGVRVAVSAGAEAAPGPQHTSLRGSTCLRKVQDSAAGLVMSPQRSRLTGR